MSKIIKTHLVNIKRGKSLKDIYIYLWIETINTNTNQPEIVIVCINAEEALKITDDKNYYEFCNQIIKIKPQDIKYFEKNISRFVRTVYEENDLINNEEYFKFCLQRLEEYKKIYYNSKFLVEIFYERYAPKEVKRKYSDVWKMFDAYDRQIKWELTPVSTFRVGGDVITFYTDELGRKRPITEPKRYKSIYDYIDMLKLCFEKEIKYVRE